VALPLWRRKQKRDAAIFYAGHHKRKHYQKQVIDSLVAADGALTIAAKRLGTSSGHQQAHAAGDHCLP